MAFLIVFFLFLPPTTSQSPNYFHILSNDFWLHSTWFPSISFIESPFNDRVTISNLVHRLDPKTHLSDKAPWDELGSDWWISSLDREILGERETQAIRCLGDKIQEVGIRSFIHILFELCRTFVYLFNHVPKFFYKVITHNQWILRWLPSLHLSVYV